MLSILITLYRTFLYVIDLSVVEPQRLDHSKLPCQCDALVTDAAYLDDFITAEEAATQDRIAAQLLSCGESLPVPKSSQTRLEDPAFVVDPDAMSSDHHAAGLVIVEKRSIDNGESVGSGAHLIQVLVN